MMKVPIKIVLLFIAIGISIHIKLFKNMQFHIFINIVMILTFPNMHLVQTRIYLKLIISLFLSLVFL